MLEAIRISKCATYGPDHETLGPLKEANFIYGTNGSGKTTISRVVASPAAYSSCELNWRNGRALKALVFNSDFIRDNYGSEMPGIFTLGNQDLDLQAEVEAKRQKLSRLRDEIDGLNRTLSGANGEGGKREELKRHRSDFEEACWQVKSRHDAHFQEAFTGVRNSKKLFCDRLLQELGSNQAGIKALDDLKSKASSLFDKSLARLERLAVINANQLLDLETASILSKRIVGKEDIDVAALIRRLGNSDWVRSGLSYFNKGDDLCPFCQQTVDSELYYRLTSYFDETYNNDIAAVARVHTSYRQHATSLMAKLIEIGNSESIHLDSPEYDKWLARLQASIDANIVLLQRKASEPSNHIELNSTADEMEAISGLIIAANNEINAHNMLMDNLAAEQRALKAEIWKCVIEESRIPIDTFVGKNNGLKKAIESLERQIAEKSQEALQVRSELTILESQITSVQPTVTAINQTLAAFGFSSFRLATAGEMESRYKLERHDGSDAAQTLSEGEKSFITFLYFYHSIRGSMTSSGTTEDRIVVFDDPISSLDSDVLFMVSTLIKEFVREAKAGNARVKQVIVLTHNVYFHKEVSFSHNESGPAPTFWIVKKQHDRSVINGYQNNPIKTSYQLLWDEVKSDHRSKATIQNVLRRILENYFKIFGGKDRDEIIALFDGPDKILAASLLSWVNDGSHYIHDDISVSADDQMIEKYLRVFKEVFVKSKHEAHYKMMLGISDEPEVEIQEPANDTMPETDAG
ncbi:AAA family ATPase [Sphingobium yanoikuyae]